MKLSTRLRNTTGAAALSLTILFSGSIMAAPSAYAAGNISTGGKALVANTDGDNIRVRKGAGSDFDQVAEAHEGETVSILDGPSKDSKGNTWYKIQAPGGSGWIRSDFLAGKAQAASSKSADAPVAKAVAPTPPKLSGYAKVANTDGDHLNLRTDPKRSGSVMTTLAAATTVTIKVGPLTDSEGIVWYQISVDGQTGWAMAQYLAQTSAPAKPVAPVAPLAVPAQPAKPAAPAQAAPAPKPSAPVIQAQPAIQKVQKPVAATPAPASAPVASQADNRTGQSRGAQPPDTSAMGPSIVSIAMRYVGYRYRFGGTTPAGFDCSGFVYYVVNKAGRNISRDMYAQLGSGTRVSSSNLQPGDLLFFSGTYKGGLSHAGIYIGNGKFVHAENESTGVTVSELWSAYWAAHYTAAVRVR